MPRVFAKFVVAAAVISLCCERGVVLVGGNDIKGEQELTVEDSMGDIVVSHETWLETLETEDFSNGDDAVVTCPSTEVQVWCRIVPWPGVIIDPPMPDFPETGRIITNQELLDEVIAASFHCDSSAIVVGWGCGLPETPFDRPVDFTIEQVVILWQRRDAGECPEWRDTVTGLCPWLMTVDSVQLCPQCLCIKYRPYSDANMCPNPYECPQWWDKDYIFLVLTPKQTPICLAPCGETCAELLPVI